MVKDSKWLEEVLDELVSAGSAAEVDGDGSGAALDGSPEEESERAAPRADENVISELLSGGGGKAEKTSEPRP